MTPTDPLEWMRDVFGDAISTYSDNEAIEDGMLVPFVTSQGRDTGHRITYNAYTELTEHYKANGYGAYSDKQFHDFFLAELLPLVPEVGTASIGSARRGASGLVLLDPLRCGSLALRRLHSV
jgi:hypothetical protein